MKNLILGILVINVFVLFSEIRAQESTEKYKKVPNANFSKGSFIDSRDGKKYATVKIGNQIWMAENLAFYTDLGCWLYNNDSTNIKKYGYLYNWETALNVAPEGWHLPSDEEWNELINYLKNQNSSFIHEQSWWKGMGKELKSETGWYNRTSSELWSSSGGDYTQEIDSILVGNTSGYYNFIFPQEQI